MASSSYAKYTGLGGGGGSGGTVTSVSVVSANGLAGTVATPTTTPAITLSTTVTGLLKGNGTAISAQTTGDLTDAGTDGITVTGGTGAVIGAGTSIAQHVADATHNGYLNSTDWNTFNNKQSTLTLGNLTDAGTDGITVTAGTGAVVGSGTSIAQHVADSTHNGYLSSTDWSTFNGKQSSALTTNHILVGAAGVATDVAMSGDVGIVASGATTLATVNANVGAFGSATQVATFTVNGKGLTTAAGNTTIQIAESQVTNLVSDLAAKQSTALTTNHILVGAAGVATDVAMSGDVAIVASGATTLATVNSNVGSFTNANITVNAKGLITAAANGTGSSFTAPTVSRVGPSFHSGGFSANSTGTYTTPANVLYVRVTMCGGGGGGGGSGSPGATAGSVGTTTTFGTSLLTANGGGGGTTGGAQSPNGGTVTVAGAAIQVVALQGGPGMGGTGSTTSLFGSGGNGGNNPFAGGATGSTAANPGPAIALTGSGGAGGSTNSVNSLTGGAGGGAGGYINAIIAPTAAQTFSYAVGTGGGGGSAGTNGVAGSGGTDGIIIVEEFYQ